MFITPFWVQFYKLHFAVLLWKQRTQCIHFFKHLPYIVCGIVTLTITAFNKVIDWMFFCFVFAFTVPASAIKVYSKVSAFQVLRSLSYFIAIPLHSSRQLLRPSCHLIHFVLITLHCTSFVAIHCFKEWHTLPTHNAYPRWCTFLSQANATIFTGFHSAALVLHSFRYHSVLSLQMFELALHACQSFGFVMVLYQPHLALQIKNTRQTLA